jgi:hypothetical protein
MPTGRCKGCGKLTNSCTSNWWDTTDHKPTKCYMAFNDNGDPIKGCDYENAPLYIQKWVWEMIHR